VININTLTKRNWETIEAPC